MLRRRRLDLIEHFVVLRESSGCLLIPDLRSVDVNVEHPAGPLDHRGVDVELVLNRLRQTGGCGIVVSLHAVLDADVHPASFR